MGFSSQTGNSGSRRNRLLTVSELVLTFASLALVAEFSLPHRVMAAYGRPRAVLRPARLAQADAPVRGRLPAAAIRPLTVKRSMRVSVTAYTSTREETDHDPFTTASGEKTRDGIVAMNGVAFGTKLRFPEHFGDKVFVVADRMHPRYGTRYADIWMASRAEAKAWGVRRTIVEIVE